MEALAALLSSPAGTFFYHLATLLLIFGAIITVQGRKDAQSAFPVNRMVLGLGAILTLHLALAVIAINSNAGDSTAALNFRLERGLTAATWVILVWLWVFPERASASDYATLLLSVLIISVTLLGAGMLRQEPAPLEPLWLATGWAVFSLLASAAGLILLTRRKPILWGYGAAMLALVAASEAVLVFSVQPFPVPLVILRLTKIAAFPILLTLPQRITTEPVVKTVHQPIVRPVPERKRVNLPPNIFSKFLSLATEEDLAKLSRAITEGVSYALVADICLLVSRPTAQEEIIIFCGYDQVLEQEIQGSQIAARHLPMLASALEKQTPLRLPSSSASADLKFLSSALHLPKSGHLLVAPITTSAPSEIGALVLLTPYSSRTWTKDDQTYLADAAGRVAALLDLKLQTQGAASGGNRSVAPQAEAQPERSREESDPDWSQVVQLLQAEKLQLQLTVDELESGRSELETSQHALMRMHKETQSLMKSLQRENDKLKDQLSSMTAQGSSASPNGNIQDQDAEKQEEALREALQEIAALKNLLGEAEMKMVELQNMAASTSDVTRQWDTIITLAEEMRQPMSSILGYSDFLLTESVGMLGDLQRKFLERVKGSTSRMGAMVEDLVHIASSESGRLKLAITHVDLTSVIDSAVAATTVQMREKSIALLVDLPENLPHLEGDREAIRLTLVHLLHNAAGATPLEGEISMRIRLDRAEDGSEFVQLSVSDSGEGLRADDLPRVFDRRFKSKDTRITGLGVSNAGLSIAKTLVEAHGGRIWVENRSDRSGACFSIVLPLHQEISTLISGNRSR